ncbi:MAG: PQQ-binding-like beta-propeller repeat protein [Halolamina sp.]|uniref:outer membrane protein assembly factor BamB family protein n=1 Tax=Halolamina sp. TaxID=1940283 RepID=UPI002FC2FFBA
MTKSNRRAFLAACGLTTIAGCAAPSTTTETGATTAAAEATSTHTAADETESQTATATQKSIELGDDPVWPMFGGDAANTGRRGDGSGPAGPVEPAWKTDVGGIYTMPGPVLADGRTFVGSGERAYAMDAVTGDPLWDAAMGSLTHYFSPAIADDRVLFGAQSNIASGGDPGRLSSFSFDGREQWRRELAISSSPTAVEETVYVGESAESGAQLRALATDEGGDRWTAALDANTLRGAPAVADGIVYAAASLRGGDAGVVVARDTADGSAVWSHSVGAGVTAAPAIQNGTVYIQANDGRLLTLDAESGDPGWSVRLGESGASAPALTENKLVGLVENTLVGVDLEAGERVWETDIGYALINGVTITRGRAYVGGSRLSAVDVASGDLVWEKPIPGQGGAFGAPVIVGNTAFVGVCIKEEAGDPYDDFFYAYF